MMAAVSPTLYYTKLERSVQVEIESWVEKRKSLIRDNTNRRMSLILQSQNEVSFKSTPFIRFLCRCMGRNWSHANHKIENNDAILTIWNPTDEILESFQEGCVVRCKKLSVNSVNCDAIAELVCRDSRNMQLVSSPDSSFGISPRRYCPLMALEAVCSKNTAPQTILPEFDCAGCMIKVKDTSFGLSIYIIDESKSVLRIEREVDLEKDTALIQWKKMILNLPRGSCLFFRDIKILRFDPWEEVIVGAWTEFSSQVVEDKKEDRMKSWYSTVGQVECNIAMHRLSCGIIDIIPKGCAIVIGRIISFQLLFFDSWKKTAGHNSLHSFNWGLIIDTGNSEFQVVVPVHQHYMFSKVCQPELLTVMERQFQYSEIRILEDYFRKKINEHLGIFRFVTDCNSEYMLGVDVVEALSLSEALYFREGNNV